MGFPRYALIALFFSAIGCDRRTKDIAPDPVAKPTPSDAPVIDDAYAVWSSVIDDVVQPLAKKGARSVWITATTVTPSCERKDFAVTMPTAKPETIAELARPHPVQKIRAGLHASIEIRMRDDAPIGAFDSPSDATTPIASDPASAGVVELSFVAFDAAHRDAIVYVDHWRDARFGSGFVVHVVRDDGGWRSMEIVRCWIT